MKIEVLLFAQLKEARGSGCLCIDVPEGTKIFEAAHLIMTTPSLRPFNALPLRYAVNEEFRPTDTVLRERDRLALLSPVAGG